MKTKTWLVCTAMLALGGSAVPATAQAQGQESSRSAEGKGKSQEDEGPFAPKGRTGKLRDAAPEPTPHEAAPFPEKPNAAGVDFVFGFGKTASLLGPADVSVVSLLIGATYEFKSGWGVRLRVPVGTGKITESNPGTNAGGYNSSALGNVEVAVKRNVMSGPRVWLPVELAIAFPTASGDPFFPGDNPGSGRRYQVNAAQLAARGLEEDALFAAHRLGVVPGAALQYQRHAMIVGGFAKIPVMIRVGGEDPAPVAPGVPATTTVNSVAVEGVLGGHFRYAVLQGKVDLGARAWIAYVASEFFETQLPGATTPSKLQLVLEPSVRGAFGRIRTGLGFIWPVGGRLGGDQQIDGLRLTAAYTL